MTPTPTQPPAAMPEAMHPHDLSTVVAFLTGEAPLDGVWFGGRHPTDELGAYWWRKHLRAALSAAAPAEPAEASSEGSALQITRVDNAEGRTMCIVRWQVETPAGWVGAYNREALEALIPAPTTEQAWAQSDALRRFIDAAAGEGLVLDGIDAADLFQQNFPGEYARALAAPGGEAPAPATAAAPDALDAARYRRVRLGRWWSVIDGVGDHLSGDALDADVDRALAAQSQKGTDHA